MRIDKFEQMIHTEVDVCDLFMQDPTRKINRLLLDKNISFDPELQLNYVPKTAIYTATDVSIEEFDAECQSNWFIPIEYQQLDIAKWVLDQCTSEEELQRAGQELLMFQERDMFIVLKYLKYLVDTMRKNNIIWGVGRGSSVASFVLFLIGIHRINSLYFQLEIGEFLK
jgi:DNA polymerase III alpha subunit